jgi:hypothetical protein
VSVMPKGPTTLLVCTVVFRTGDGAFGVMPTADYDGDPIAIVHDYAQLRIVMNSTPLRRDERQVTGHASSAIIAKRVGKTSRTRHAGR